MKTTLQVTGETGAGKMITLPAGWEAKQQSPYYYRSKHTVDGQEVTEEFGFQTNLELMEFLSLRGVINVSDDCMDEMRERERYSLYISQTFEPKRSDNADLPTVK